MQARRRILTIGERDEKLDEIAREIGVTRERTRQILVSAMRKVERQLRLRGIRSVEDVLPDHHGRHDEA